MRETGSTIEIKVKTDTSSFSTEMNRVKGELEQVNQATERMSRGASKTSGMYKILAKEISGALNQFRATGDIEKAEVAFAGIRSRIDGFGSSLDATSSQMQEYYTLLNKNAQAVGILNSEYASSTGITRETAVAQRTLAEETKRSSDVLKARAKAVKFDADLQKRANQEVRNSIEGVIAELRGLSVKGTASAEQVSRLFLRTANTAEDLTVTTDDLTQAFVRQAQALQASEVPYKNKQKLLNQITIAEQQTAQSIRVVNRGLSQQGEGVGDVSYAMMSFTRLLEDTPYGFRGFANNIQPTVFGLVQMNEKTEAAAAAFRKLHGKDMPLAQRAMLNLKTAFSGPINQLLLLTSVIAVAGTMIERWSQQSNKAKQATKTLGDEFLRLYDVTKGDNPLDTDYTKSIEGLKQYSEAIESIFLLAEEAEVERALNVGMTGASLQGAGMLSQQVSQISKEEAKRFETAKNLNKETKDRLKALQAEADVQSFLLGSEKVRAALQAQYNQKRVDSANEEILKTQELIQVEQVRQAQGEEAAIRLQSALRMQKIEQDTSLKAEDRAVLLKEEQLKLDLELLRLAGKKTNESKKQADQFSSIAQSLARQLEDESSMFSVQRLQVDRARELADLNKQIADIRASGGTVTIQQAEQARLDIIQRYSGLIAGAENASQRTVKNLTQQFLITNKTLQAEQARILGQDRLGTQLEFEAMELEFQLDLREKLNGLTEEDYKDAGDKATAEAMITKELEAQYRMRLLTRAAQSRQGVRDFLTPPDESDVANVQQRAEQANLDAYNAYFTERTQIEEQYKNDFQGRMVALARITARYANDRIKIERFAAFQIAMIRASAYTEGAIMIISALENLTSSTEAKNRQQFESQKRLSASLATINTFLAVSQVLASTKMTPFMKFATATSMALAGFAQVRQILATKYGGASTGGFSAPSGPSQGFIESDAEARGGVSGTVINTQPQITVNVTGKVDREGIAFMVNDGFDQIGSRGVVLQ